MNTYFCSLVIRRNIHPPTQWHWAVEMPNGHCFTCSKGAIMSLSDVMADATTNGVEALKQAEQALAAKDGNYAKAIGHKGVEP